MTVVQHTRGLSGSQSSSTLHSQPSDSEDAFASPIAIESQTAATLQRAASEVKQPPAARARRMTVGTTGVKHMVEQIEQRNSVSEPRSVASTPKSSPRKPRTTKVEHGFAPRPQLVLANPD